MLASRAKRARSTGPLRVLFDNLYHYATPITTYVLPCAVNLGNVTAILTLQTPLLLLMCWRCRRYNLFMSACHIHCAYDRRSVSPTAVHAFEAGYLVARFTVSSQGGHRTRHPLSEQGELGTSSRVRGIQPCGPKATNTADSATRIDTADSRRRADSPVRLYGSTRQLRLYGSTATKWRVWKALLISRLPTAARVGQGIKGSSLTAGLRKATRAFTCSQ